MNHFQENKKKYMWNTSVDLATKHQKKYTVTRIIYIPLKFKSEIKRDLYKIKTSILKTILIDLNLKQY